LLLPVKCHLADIHVCGKIRDVLSPKIQICAMIGKLRGLWRVMREVRSGNLDPQVRAVLAREEENGARALLFFRLLVFVFFIIGGVTASPDIKDIISNLVFAAAYGLVIFLQWYLLRRQLHRALHRFNFFLILADHALFAGLLVFYYSFYSAGNFNHAMKSPYVVLLVLPTITTLVQFRHTLLFFSLVVVLSIILAFFGFAKLSGVPQTTNWLQYILGDAIIFPAWLGIWLLLPIVIAAMVGYAIFRSIRMVSEIGKIESQKMQLARYFSPDVVEEISAANPGENTFKKGERRAVAVLFADIRSFTTLSENMPPDLVAEMLSRSSRT
jgi:adenylate cyclase